MFPSRRITTLGGEKFKDEHSLAFDGTDDYVNCGTSSDLDVGTSEFSVSVWFKLTDLTNSFGIVSKGDGLSSAPFDAHGWAITHYNSNNRIYFDAHAGTDGTGTEDVRITANSGSALSVNRWYHCVCTRTTSGANSLYSVYIDGVIKATTTATDGGDKDALAADGTKYLVDHRHAENMG